MLEEQARAMRHVERRLVRLESGRSESGTPPSTRADSEPGPKGRYVRLRTYLQLVTLEAEPDEDLVYGDATPAIVEWRGVRAEFLKTLKTGTTLDRTEVQERMLELEIAIVEEHGLTLPPPGNASLCGGHGPSSCDGTMSLMRMLPFRSPRFGPSPIREFAAREYHSRFRSV